MKKSALFVTLAPLAPVAFILWAFRNHPWSTLRICGFVLVLSGFALLTIARVHQGNSFSIVPRAHTLVRGGIYSRIRHPVYIFGTLALSGLALYVNLPWLLLLLLILVPVQIARARAEEKLLATTFGDGYTQYKSGTWL